MTQVSSGREQQPSPAPGRAGLSQPVLTAAGKARGRELQRSDSAGALGKTLSPTPPVCRVQHQKYQGLMTTGVMSEGLTLCVAGALLEDFFPPSCKMPPR